MQAAYRVHNDAGLCVTRTAVPSGTSAVVRGKTALRSRYDHYIGGRWVTSRKGQCVENLAPITAEVIGEVARSTAADIELALDAAHAAKAAWRRTSPGVCAAVLNQVVDQAFWISGPTFEYRQHTHLTQDVVPGRGAGFSLESPLGVRFLIRTRLYTEAEVAALRLAGPQARGAVAQTPFAARRASHSPKTSAGIAAAS